MLKFNAVDSPSGLGYQIGEMIRHPVIYLQHLSSKAYILNLMGRSGGVNHRFFNILVAISVYND